MKSGNRFIIDQKTYLNRLKFEKTNRKISNKIRKLFLMFAG